MKLNTLIEKMPFKTYLLDPAPEPSLTSSLVRDLLTTAPRKVWDTTPRLNAAAMPENKTIFDDGTAAHALFLGAGGNLSVIDAKTFQSGDARKLRDEAYAAGITPILRHKFDEFKIMAKAARTGFGQSKELGPLMDACVPEATVIWTEAGVMHRCRPDWYHPGTNTVIHYKTTKSKLHPSTLAKYAASSGWDFIAAHYGAGFYHLTGKHPRQLFAVQENTAPYLTLVCQLDKAFTETAMMRRNRAITIWGRCLASNTWPGFPNDTITLESPGWHETSLIAEKDIDSSPGPDLLERAMLWQAPSGWEPPAKMGKAK